MNKYELTESDLTAIAEQALYCYVSSGKGNVLCTIEAFLTFLGGKKLKVESGVIQYEKE
jgi:hypothetical protein